MIVATDLSIAALYDLGYHVPTGCLVRIPSARVSPTIPPGCVRVKRYRSHDAIRAGWWTTPYDQFGYLLPGYWALPRAQDVRISA